MAIPILPVIVSSTWLDLQPEREAVRDAILRMKETQFVGMEYFGSRDETTRRASLDDVDRSSIYVGIFAARYGSGITEDEYRRARERGLPCLIYFKSDATIPDDLRETDAAQTAKLDALKQELRTNHIIGTHFTNPDNLAAKVTADLHNWLFKEYLTPILERAARGEVRRSEVQQLLDGIRDFSGLDQNLLSSLRRAGFNIASGTHAVAVSGEDNQAVSGDDNVVANRTQGDVVKGNKIVYEGVAPAIPTQTLHQLRAPVGDFVGREKEIAELLKTLRGGGSAAITGISGMGGIGKTELSFYVAERLRDAYPDAQLVLDMRGTDERPRDPADALASCIRAFVGLEQRLPDDTEELTRLYRSVLEGRRALILLDNAAGSAQVRPLLPPAGSALLVTSRETIPIPGMKRVTLEQLRPVEARELLTSIAPRVAPEVADEICRLSGYLPLAVRAAASLLDITPDLDPDSYAAQLGDERTRLERIGFDPTIGIDVAASIGLSYKRLAPDAALVFRRLAVFPATFDAAAEEVICEDENHKHLSELLRRNLVLYNLETHRYRLHDLVRLFADLCLSEAERSAGQMRHATHYLSVLKTADGLYLQGGEFLKSGVSLFDLEWRNIQAGQAWAERNKDEDNAASLCSSYAGTGVYLFLLRQHPREHIRWLEAALASARQLKDRAAEGVHLGHLGIAHDHLGETSQSINFFEQSLAILRDTVNRAGEGAVLNNLGNAYHRLGDFSRAVECKTEALTIAREVKNPRLEGEALLSLGAAHESLGEHDLAVEFLEQGLAIIRKIGDTRYEGIALGIIGWIYERKDDLSRAMESYRQQLAIVRDFNDQPGKGEAFWNISRILAKQGDIAQAITYAEDALKIYEYIEDSKTVYVRQQLSQWRAQGGSQATKT